MRTGSNGEILLQRIGFLETRLKELEEEGAKRGEAEKVLKAERQRLHDVLEAMPVMVRLLTTDYHVAFANRAFREKFGESRGRRCYEYCFGKKEPCDFCQTYQVLKTGNPHRWQVANPDAAGVIDIYDFPLTDVDGAPMILEVGIDITERKQAEEMLRAEKERWRLLFESAPDGIYISDLKGTFVDGNRAAEEIAGYKREEMIGKNFMNLHLLTANDIPRAAASLAKNVAGKSTGPDEFTLKRKDGSIVIVEIKTYPLETQGRPLVLGIARDVTARKKSEKDAEAVLEREAKSREILIRMLEDNNRVREELERKLAELKQAEAMLVQSEKLASLGKLVSDMAHEVNNPLMIISGRAQLTLMDKQGDRELEENMRIIVDQCMRAKDIIQRLLVFSKPSIGETKRADINKSAEFVIRLLEHQFSIKNISIRRNYSEGLPPVLVDEKQMQEVYMNLLKNALEAMPAGGSITVATSAEAGKVKIDFTDTGEGISKENIKKVFDPFFTTKKEGTGLGLSVCYGIIKAHGGDIAYTSAPGEGTTASIWLPAQKG